MARAVLLRGVTLRQLPVTFNLRIDHISRSNMFSVPKTADGSWQFKCPICNYWNLASSDGMVNATSRERFDLERLPTNLRGPQMVTREPSGGI
jgi:hypothetical protein